MPSFKRPLKLAYFSPLPPEPSGISDYSRELLPYLARWAEVHLYIDDYQLADKEIAWEFPVFNYREFPWRRPLYDYDCTLYHLGNSAVHRYLYPYVSQHPGVVVLHDWVLHHFLAGQALDYGHSGGYVREMTYAMGPDRRKHCLGDHRRTAHTALFRAAPLPTRAGRQPGRAGAQRLSARAGPGRRAGNAGGRCVYGHSAAA